MLDELIPSTDSFMNMDTVMNRLYDEFNKYGHIVVAFDYDDTVSPNQGSCCNDVVDLLREVSTIPEAELVIFTTRGPSEFDKVKNDVTNLGIRFDAINRNVPRLVDTFGDGSQSKIFYSIFLDDRAGLALAYRQLKKFIRWYRKEKGGVFDGLFD